MCGVPRLRYWTSTTQYATIRSRLRKGMAEAIEQPKIEPAKLIKTGPMTQTWVLIYRRVVRLYDKPSKYLPSYALMLMVSIIVGIAFSYKDPNALDTNAYESMMFVFVMSTYAMMNQYIIFLPVYFDERQIIENSRSSRGIQMWAYLVSPVVDETVAALTQCVLVAAASVFEARLNDDLAFAWFAFSMLVTGVCSFQALISFIALSTENIAMAYNVVFMVLGIGGVFGGVFVTYAHIPTFFQWAYYSTIPMMVFRALVINDMQCCHLTADCKNIVDYYRNNRFPGWASLATDSANASYTGGGIITWNETLYNQDPFFCFNSSAMVSPQTTNLPKRNQM